MAKGKREGGDYSLGAGASSRVAKRVRDLLEEKGMTQYTLCQATGIPTSHMSDLLKVESADRPRNFNSKSVRAIAKALGTSEGDLLGRALPGLVSDEKNADRGPKSDSGSTLPPNVEDFLARREAELGADVVEIFRSGFRFTELQYATESELLDLAERAKRFAERAAASRAARGAGRGVREK